MTDRFQRVLQGRGRVIAARLQPGAFYSFLPEPQHKLVGQRLSINRIFPELNVPKFEQKLFSEPDETAMAATLESLFLANPRIPDSGQLQVLEIYQAMEDQHFDSVGKLARSVGVSARTMQRLFRHYVGLTPKWVLARQRLHNALELIQQRPEQDLTTLSAELGYADHAHFTRDFRAIVGMSPQAYRAAPS